MMLTMQAMLVMRMNSDYAGDAGYAGDAHHGLVCSLLQMADLLKRRIARLNKHNHDRNDGLPTRCFLLNTPAVCQLSWCS